MIGSQNKELITYEIHSDSNEDPPKCEGSDMGKNKLQNTLNTAKIQKTSKTKRLLVNPDVKRWYDNIARGSPITAEVRLRRLYQFCESHSMTPLQVVELALKDLRTVTDLIEDHITQMEEKEYSPGYVEDIVKAVKSWLRHYDIEIKRKLRITNIKGTPTLENERVPDANEMAEIFNRAQLRSATSISLMSKSGLRPQVLGNHDGTDGLMIKDLPDIIIHQGVAKSMRSPSRIIVRKTLSKARHQYFTFLTQNGTKKLLAYLNSRLARGEPLTAESPVIAPDMVYKTFRGKNVGKRFLPTRRICNEIRGTFRPRFSWRPYVLRAYFDTELLIAEARGKIAHDFRVFFMGHKGTIEARYTTNKGVLPDALINEMSDAFKRSEIFLDLELKEEDPLLKQKDDLHRAIEGATPDKVQEMLRILTSAMP